MSSYGYAPPPPPPATTKAAHQQPAYGHRSNAGYGQGRNVGPSGRGRGGHHTTRQEYQPSQPVHYEYAAQPYAHHAAPTYGGQHPPAGGYVPSQPQWSSDHAHQAQPPHAHAHTQPLIASSGYPGYGPQPYPPAQHPQSQPAYAPPQHYGAAYQGAPPPTAPPQWNNQASYASNSRSRGGYNNRGGAVAGPMQPYEHEQPSAPVVAGYGQAYPHDPRAGSYPPAQYHYGAPPPAPPSARKEGYHGHHQRGRGGGQRGRGRGGHNSGDRARHHNNKGQADHRNNQNAKNAHQQQPQPKHEGQAAGKKKKRKTNTLGLTPGMDSDTEDDEGEEKTLAQLLGPDTYVPSDVAKYLAERKKNFPTKARAEAKKSEVPNKSEDKTSELEKEADRLRRQLRKVESSIKRKREQGDEGDEMRDSPAESSDDDQPEVMSTRSSAHAQKQASSPPAKKADVTRHCKYYSTGGTCGKKSKCRFVHDPEVREAAMKDREANNGRLTIQQRLILNDKEQEDLAVLESIQYLREKGIMDESEKAAKENGTKFVPVPVASSSQAKAARALPSKKPATSLLPAASASLPPVPVKREPVSLPRRNNPPPSIIPTANSISAQGLEHYQGWLLKPYGSSSGSHSKSDDLP